MLVTFGTMKRQAVAIVLLAASAIALHASQAKPEEEKCSIEGRVTNAATGEPVKKATLMLAGGGGASSTILKAASGDDGAFSFKDVPQGQYQLIAERAGFARQAYGAKSNPLSGTPLVLSAGQRMKDLAFKLSPDAVIAGRVLDEDGEVVPSAIVLAMRATYQRGEKTWLPLGTAQANDLGEFRLSGLGAGRYVLAAALRPTAASIVGVSTQDPGNAPERENITTYYPNAREPGNAVPVDVTSGSEAKGMDLRLIRTQTVRVKGKIAGMADTKQVLVRLVPRGAGILSMITGKMTMIQEANGAFEFSGVAPGAYLLTAGPVSSLLGGGGASATMPLQVEDQHITGIVLSPGGGSEVPGTVLADSKDAVKLDAVQLTLTPRDFVSLSAPNAKAGEDGKFTLKNVSPDRYLLQVSGNPPNSYVKRIGLGDTDVTEEDIDFTRGVAGSLQVTLGLAGAQVDGVVQGAEDKPVSGATVVLVPDSRRYSLFKEARTGDNGSYSFKGVAPGDYKILAWTDIESGTYQDPDFLRRYESKAEQLSLKESDRKTVSLKAIPAE